MKKIFHYAIDWITFRLYYHSKILRPKNLIINGRIRIDFSSIIHIDKKSKLFLGEGMHILKSRISIKNSNVKIEAGGKIQEAVVDFRDSDIQIGEHLIIDKTMIDISANTVFRAGSYNMYTSENYYLSGLFIVESKITMGDNVNIFALTRCFKSVFTVGSNVFLNPGTQIRCNKEIIMGNNILVSYECILFDNNSHSLDHRDRYKEMSDGFPNKVEQNLEIKAAVKAESVILGNDVWIGMRSFILKGSTLGDRVIVGAGSVVAGQKVADDKKAFGNPIQIR